MTLSTLKKIPLILASESPRRKKLLSILNIDFEVIPPNIEEEPKPNESHLHYVKRVAKDKALVVDKFVKNKIILSADTIVVIDGLLLGKPQSKIEAERMLLKLSGRTHKVITAICCMNQLNNKIITDYEITDVTFRKLNRDEIREYVNTGSCMDKAGAYGIQEDFGAVFVKKIYGCYYNVVGLPLVKTYLSLIKVLK
ncbi:MAG: Maf family protein [Ignavibacteria bacterium]|nr:Maf family protein [Ignavibacteria bacterium]